MTVKRILLIHSGGTIGMARSRAGFAPRKGLVEDAVTRITASGPHGAPEVSVLALEPLIDSANATPHDWNRIAETIDAHVDQADGFVVTHGTDTLAFTAAALTMALAGLTRPVVLTGAMLPLAEPGSDGQRNLTDALTAVANAPAGVWVQFAGRRLHGARIRKTHSHSFDAFAAEPTDMPPLRRGADGAQRHVFGRPDVAVLPVVPGGSGNVLMFAASHCDGLVLRCFGSGTVPNTARTKAALQTACDRGIPVLAVSQCPEGGMTFGTYAAGAILIHHDVVDGRDMTMEAAYVKMVLALSMGMATADCRAFLARPLCGEFRQTTD